MTDSITTADWTGVSRYLACMPPETPTFTSRFGNVDPILTAADVLVSSMTTLHGRVVQREGDLLALEGFLVVEHFHTTFGPQDETAEIAADPETMRLLEEAEEDFRLGRDVSGDDVRGR